jgi:hypothetical protein
MFPKANLLVSKKREDASNQRKGHRPFILESLMPNNLTHLPPWGKLAKRILQNF